MTTLNMHTHRTSNMNTNLTMSTRLTKNVFPVKHNTDTNTNRNVFVNNFINELPKPPLRRTVESALVNVFVNDFLNRKFGEIGHFDEIKKYKFLTDNAMTTAMNMTMNTDIKKFKFNTNGFVNDFVNGGGGAP